MLNDKLMLLERVFLLPQGLPDRQNFRNAIFSPSKLNSYGKIQFWQSLKFLLNNWIIMFSAGTSFPGIRDLMQDFDKRLDNQKIVVIERVRKHLSEIMMVFRQAKNWLEDGDIWENMNSPISHFNHVQVQLFRKSDKNKRQYSTHVVVKYLLYLLTFFSR